MLKYSYEYDDLGQLTRENDANKGQTCVYVYDNAGNITLRKVYAYTTAGTVTGEPTYTTVYGYTDSSWGDKLTSYDGRAITYDEIGNPLSYYNGVEYTLAWTAGRQLQSASFAGNLVSYTYNDEGIRTCKTVGGIVHEYHLVGTQILSEEWNENGIQHLIVYHYDAAGLPIGMTYRNSGYSYYECDTFIYVKNLQGDIIKVLDVSGNLLVSYTYDAWGSPVTTTYSNGGASTAARFNPFRYRGYYYDTETGFYYLNSRYYDSEIGRFINADNRISGVGGDIRGYNPFVYCYNNPVNLDDPTGNWPEWLKSTVKWVAKNIVKPVVKTVEDITSNLDLTYSSGINLSVTPTAVIFNGQIGVSMDTDGNVAVQFSGGGGFSAGTSGISITGYQSVTNAPNIGKLNDEYYQIGGSIVVPIEGVNVAAGGDVMFIPDKELNDVYYGLSKNFGWGSPGQEFHVEWGQTATLTQTQFNIYDIARTVYNRIMEW